MTDACPCCVVRRCKDDSAMIDAVSVKCRLPTSDKVRRWSSKLLHVSEDSLVVESIWPLVMRWADFSKQCTGQFRSTIQRYEVKTACYDRHAVIIFRKCWPGEAYVFFLYLFFNAESV